MKTKTMKSANWLLVAAAAVVFAPLAQAGEAIFPNTYLAETLPKGGLEGEQWLTYREGKSQGTYQLTESRTELEYGITDRWQISLYANAYSVKAENNNSQASRNDFTVGGGDGDEVTGGGPATFGPKVPNTERLPIPSALYKKTDFDSVSVESVYQFLSPYKSPVGLSGYVEYTVGSDVKELEFKGLLQKNLLEDQLILAANLAVEFEEESYSQGGTEKETEVELSGGASYRFAPGWRAGAELRNVRGYAGHSLGSDDRKFSVWYAGPMVSYGAKQWFAVLGYQAQLPWAEAYDRFAANEQISGRNYLGGEKNVLRLKLGVNFK